MKPAQQPRLARKRFWGDARGLVLAYTASPKPATNPNPPINYELLAERVKMLKLTDDLYDAALDIAAALHDGHDPYSILHAVIDAILTKFPTIPINYWVGD